MKIIDLKKFFFTKKLNKHKYIKKIYNNYHNLLFQYSNLIKKTDISEIRIISSGVIMSSKKYKVSFSVPPEDHRSAS